MLFLLIYITNTIFLQQRVKTDGENGATEEMWHLSGIFVSPGDLAAKSEEVRTRGRETESSKGSFEFSVNEKCC